uniref:Olfactory receptor family 51 subfamily L member 1 n=1 Tax=Piliocolobus tephrosceles TaxID=591936 RepID=A0A8C9LMC0_9PRIM
MIDWNNSDAMEPIFILRGFSGLEYAHSWLSILFCLAYLVAFMGNVTILSVIWTGSSLHQPMYYFISILAGNDLGMSLSTLITMLTAGACYAQLFFIHTFTFLESSVLLAMDFDRFVAICHPLHYPTILTKIVLPTPLLLRHYQYCHGNALSHAFCLHQDVLRLSCTDARINSIYGLCVVIATLSVDSVFILLSYVLILDTVLGIASREEQLKALNTCVSHICVVLIFFVPVIGVSMVHRFGKHPSPIVHVLMADIYLLLPPVLNPIVYSVRTKQIHLGILFLLCRPDWSAVVRS